MKPEKLEDLILPERIKKLLTTLDCDNIVNMMFSGSQGLGKSLSCTLLAQELGMPTIRIDLSDKDQRGVDFIDELKEKIERKTNKRKLVIIDEVDNISSKMMALLKNIMDEYASDDNNRAVFLLTTNHPNKVQLPVSNSRCLHINFNLKDSEKKDIYNQATDYCKKLLMIHGVEINDELRESIAVLLRNTLPDFRLLHKILNLGLEHHKKHGEVSLNFSNITAPNVVVEHIVGFIKAKDFDGFVDWYHNNVTTEHKTVILNLLKRKEITILKEAYYFASEYIHRIDTGKTPDIHLIAFIGTIIGNL